MSESATAFAKLAGIRQAVENVAAESDRRWGKNTNLANFPPRDVQHYFAQAAKHLDTLRRSLPELFDDFQPIDDPPAVEMSGSGPPHYSHLQVVRLVRNIGQIFEIRANSQLAQPRQEAVRRVFVSHGHSNDWRAVQIFDDKDVQLRTLELEQEPSSGQTVIEKLDKNSGRCDSAVIVMTGDDVVHDVARVRENVMHEIGFFQGRYGRRSVILLYEEGVNVPSNLDGIVYIPFPKGSIQSGFHVLQRELKAIYDSIG